MSAYLVHPDQIDLLVTAGLARIRPHGCSIYGSASDGASRDQHAELTVESATEFGLMLWRENLKSINYRYPDTLERPDRMPCSGPTDVDAYQFKPIRPTSILTGIPRHHSIPSGVIVNAIAGYEYQSCEHPEWRDSLSRAYCDWLKDQLLNELSDRDSCDGWNWTRSDT